MGRRGPPPKPTDIRLLEGNRGRLKINPNEVQYDRAIPDKPEGISPAASKIWDDLVREMGGAKRGSVLRRVDQRALWQLAEDEALLAEAYQGLWRMQSAVKRKAQAEKTGPGLGALLSIMGMSQGRLAMCAIRDLAARVVVERREFGLTPASRTRVATEATMSAPEESLEMKLCGS
jgi:phage terminase small subunit